MEDQRKDKLEKIGEANKHVIKIIEISTNRSLTSGPILIVGALAVGILIAVLAHPAFWFLPAAFVILALNLRVKKGFQSKTSGFTIINKKFEQDYYDWSEVESFGFTQKAFGNGILEIAIRGKAPVRLDVKTPQFDPSIGTVIDILESNIPVSKPRYFKLFRKGQHFVENISVALMFLIPGSIALGAGILFALLPLAESSFRISSSILLCGLGFSITGIGLDILIRVRRPPLKNSLTEPIIFSKMPDRLTKIVSSGAAFFILWIWAALALGSNNVILAPYWALFISIGLMLAYNLRASAWSTFEEIVVTEGKIRIRRFRKVYEAFLDDISIEISPRSFLDRLTIESDSWKIEVADHIVAGEKLSDLINKLKNGKKLRPILSEEHPGFKFEYNDAD